MSLTIPGSLRTLTAMAAGVALGAMFVAPVLAAAVPGGTRPVAIQTRATSCSGYDFQPLDHETKQAFLGPEVYRIEPGGDGFFVCHPDLPHRAVVTRVQFTVADRYTGNVQFCGLYRMDLKAMASGNAQELASVPATDLATGGGVKRLGDSSIQRATIDHTHYAYWLQCQLNATGRISTAPPNAGLRGATVTYRISAADG